MKLKGSFLTQEVNDMQFLVPVGKKTFSGIIRSNPTAAFIVNLLREDTTEEAIVDAMFERYDAPREEIAADVAEALDTLRKIGGLAE